MANAVSKCADPWRWTKDRLYAALSSAISSMESFSQVMIVPTWMPFWRSSGSSRKAWLLSPLLFSITIHCLRCWQTRISWCRKLKGWWNCCARWWMCCRTWKQEHSKKSANIALLLLCSCFHVLVLFHVNGEWHTQNVLRAQLAFCTNCPGRKVQLRGARTLGDETPD